MDFHLGRTESSACAVSEEQRSTERRASEHGATAQRALHLDVIRGLSCFHKSIPCKYLYDQPGSDLFEKICELDEYYPTRTELQIMQMYSDAMAKCIGPKPVVVELGSGSSRKTRLLLDKLHDPVAYVPIDISASHMNAAVRRIRFDYPSLRMQPIAGDFMQSIDLPTRYKGNPVCVYFPGSTIGNLEHADAKKLLQRIRGITDPDGCLLIGFDLQKDPAVLYRAYNDSKGITAAFNVNLLSRINRELGANFDLSCFSHLAFYNAERGRIEIYLESTCHQTVFIAGRVFHFHNGERILTEYSHKYTVEGFSRMAASTGLSLEKVWTDERRYFAVVLFKPGNGDETDDCGD